MIRAARQRAARCVVLVCASICLLVVPWRLGSEQALRAGATGHGTVPGEQTWLTSITVPYEDPPRVERYEILELVFDVTEQASNPFDTYLLKLAVRDPAGRIIYVDGFYDGDGVGGQSGSIWKARLGPYAVGTWTWWTVEADVAAPSITSLAGSFEVVESDKLGGLVADGQHFRLQNGEPIYLVGNFLDIRAELLSTHVYMGDYLSDEDRAAILSEQVTYHRANKVNLYLANVGDYDYQSVTPWLGIATSSDKTRMDLARWRHYDAYLNQWREAGLLTELWFFADDSGFGALSLADQQRLVRYAMARTSVSSATLYVLALEWAEGFTRERINALGEFTQAHNPWGRLVSVHNQTDWAFSDQSWPGFAATQAGNNALPSEVNRVASEMHRHEHIPHIDEEFGILGRADQARLRASVWANLCGGAAGCGTGGELAHLQTFLASSGLPWQRMTPRNDLISDGGETRFGLAEAGHHYLFYSRSGEMDVSVDGQGLVAHWFNPRTGAWVGAMEGISPGQHVMIPPTEASEDWALWITDGTNLNSGRTHVAEGADLGVTQDVYVENGQFAADLTLRNAGPTLAMSVCITDTLPSCVSQPTATAQGVDIVARSGYSGAWCLEEPMAVGSEVHVSLQGRCSCTGKIYSTAQVWWPGIDPDLSNNQATIWVYPIPFSHRLYVPLATDH